MDRRTAGFVRGVLDERGIEWVVWGTGTGESHTHGFGLI